MHQMIYAFGIGFAFAVGTFTGAFFAAMATKRGREEYAKTILEHQTRVEDRLAKYVAHTERIALAIELATKK